MAKRKGLSKKTRFEVFKRDSFACQYCGQRAPEVVLQCDHVIAVSKGGSDDILNLITSCVDCNSGKGARSLSDQSALVKQVDQLAELQAKREQIEMMIAWREGLANAVDDAIDGVLEAWSRATEGTRLNKAGRDFIRKIVKEFGLDLTLRAVPESVGTYARRGDDDAFTPDSIMKALGKLRGVARVLRDAEEKPYLKRIFYIRGILRGRLPYIDEKAAIGLLDKAAAFNADLDAVQRLAKTTRSWSEFRGHLQKFIEDHAE